MRLYPDCELQLMLCVASPLPQKYEENPGFVLETQSQPFGSEKMVLL